MSIDFNKNETLWVEKYRPTKLKDCILSSQNKAQLQQMIKDGNIPNMLFFGSAGTGKTTAARVLANELDMDYMIINASEERGLDVIRERIASFASTVSLSGNGKLFILDEADHLLPATQAALRNATEHYRKCSFIMTANYPNRIIEPLHSRFPLMDFNLNKNEMVEMQGQFFGRVLKILDNEGVEYDQACVAKLVTKLYPDNRKILGALQQYSKNGKIDEGILLKYADTEIESLIGYIKDRKFKSILQWCEQNKDNDLSTMYQNLYKELLKVVAKKSIPDMIITLEDAQRYDSIVPSKELHLAALCTELMQVVEFE